VFLPFPLGRATQNLLERWSGAAERKIQQVDLPRVRPEALVEPDGSIDDRLVGGDRDGGVSVRVEFTSDATRSDGPS
jgi:hypothetical protein